MTTLKEVLDAIDSLFGDTSRTKEETRDLMDEISTHANMKAECLRDEIRQERP